jgi:hypothetical protein
MSLGDWMSAEFGKRLAATDQGHAVTGAHFRFMDLPSELRMMVYDHVTSCYVCPHTKNNDPYEDFQIRVYHPYWATNNNPKVRLNTSHGLIFLRPTELNGVCRQIRAEFKDATWGPKTFTLFYEHARFNRFVPYLSALRPKFALQKIMIDFTNYHYLQFLGIHPGTHAGFTPWDGDAGIAKLRDLTTVHHVHFQFTVIPPQPRQTDNSMISYNTWDPWGHIIRPGVHTGIQGSCQRTFVDWFFTLALADIRHIPRITFGGNVKDSTKAKWEAIFQDEREGKMYDFAEAIAAIQSIPLRHL